MWEGLVASHFGKGFLVESWMRGQELVAGTAGTGGALAMSHR